MPNVVVNPLGGVTNIPGTFYPSSINYISRVSCAIGAPPVSLQESRVNANVDIGDNGPMESTVTTAMTLHPQILVDANIAPIFGSYAGSLPLEPIAPPFVVQGPPEHEDKQRRLAEMAEQYIQRSKQQLPPLYVREISYR